MPSITPQNVSDTKITVTSTATRLYDLIDTASGTKNAQQYYDRKLASALFIQPEDGDIRYLINGSPTATEGILIKQGNKEWLPGIELFGMELISTSGNVAVTVVPYISRPGEDASFMATDVSLVDADIQIGAVEIKDGDSDTRVDVASDGVNNAMLTRSSNYAFELDKSNSSFIYIGLATIGSATSATAWQIQRLDQSSTDTPNIKWADGNDSFDNIWDNRASLTYS